MMALLTWLYIFSTVATVIAKSNPPNIILILMDDLGYSDVGYYGGNIATPNMDNLAQTGIRLNYHYTEGICSATRSALLSGRYAWKSQLDDVIGLPSKQGIDTSFDLISDILSNNGYDTLLAGKWHVGASSDAQLPHQRGFQQSLYFTQSQNDYYKHELCLSWALTALPGIESGEVNPAVTLTLLNQALPEGLCAYDLWKNNHQSLFETDTNQYVEDIFANKIKSFLDERCKSKHARRKRGKHSKKKNKKPFFIYWPMQTPHTPILTPPETSDVCDVLIGENRQIQCNMVYYADKLIGEIIDKLKDTRLYKDTLIIFVSDNGAQPPLPMPSIGNSAGLTLPFRGAKMNVFEGGIRTPALINGGYLNNNNKKKKFDGCDYNELVYVADFYAIIAGLANIKDIDEGIDSIDILEDIKQECGLIKRGNGVKREEIISFRMSGDGIFLRAYVYKGDYKLLVNPNVFDAGPFIQTALDTVEFWTDYDGTQYLEPNEAYYRLYTEFDRNNNNQNLFYSQCFENYLSDPVQNNINTEAYDLGDGNNLKLYLYKIKEDNIEACNIAEENVEIVYELLSILQGQIDAYRGSGGVVGDKGSYLAIRDSYDCDKEISFYVKSDDPEYQNITDDWDSILLSFIDTVESCPVETK